MTNIQLFIPIIKGKTHPLLTIDFIYKTSTLNRLFEYL